MKNIKGKELSPCIISWAIFALKVKTKKPKNNKKCSLKYWHDVINTILLKPKYSQYLTNKQNAIKSYEFVSKL